MTTFKSFILTAILLALVGLSFYFFYKNIFYRPMLAKTNNKKPSVLIEQVKVVNFDKNGAIQMILTAPTMTYNSYSKVSELATPHIIVYKTNHTKQAPWIITANKGIIYENKKIYQLVGNVQLTQGAGGKIRSMIIKTPELTIYPDQHLALTHKAITFTQVNQDNTTMTIQSVGAKANQKTGDVKLLSQTKGVYDGQ